MTPNTNPPQEALRALIQREVRYITGGCADLKSGDESLVERLVAALAAPVSPVPGVEVRRSDEQWIVLIGPRTYFVDDDDTSHGAKVARELAASLAPRAEAVPCTHPEGCTDCAWCGFSAPQGARREASVIDKLLATEPMPDLPLTIRSIADRITVAVNNPTSHGGPQGMCDFVKCEASRLRVAADHVAALTAPAGAEGAPAVATELEPVAWLHAVVQGDGEPDQALSFAPDNFPLRDELGFRSLGAVPLYRHPPLEWLREDMLALADGVERGEVTGVVWPQTIREWVAAIAHREQDAVAGGDAEWPDVGSVWLHANGNRYTVTGRANDAATRPDYPPVVLYRGEDGKHWAKPLAEWHRNRTLAATPAPAVERETDIEMMVSVAVEATAHPHKTCLEHDEYVRGVITAAMTFAPPAEAREPEPRGAVDAGPWSVGDETAHGAGGMFRIFVQSEDFTHDVRLYVNGDFASDAQRLAYAEGIARQLNAAHQAQGAAVDANEFQKAADDMIRTGTGFMRDSKRIDPASVFIAPPTPARSGIGVRAAIAMVNAADAYAKTEGEFPLPKDRRMLREQVAMIRALAAPVIDAWNAEQIAARDATRPDTSADEGESPAEGDAS